MDHGLPNYPRAEALAADVRAVRAALRAFFALADRWGLKTDEARRLLGSPSQSTFFAWKKHGANAVSPDVMLRLAHVLAIGVLLRRLFAGAPARADRWMRQPNTGPLTHGRSALEFVLDGGLVALDALHGLLQSDAGEGSPATDEALTAATR